jgi:hypothetical protein
MKYDIRAVSENRLRKSNFEYAEFRKVIISFVMSAQKHGTTRLRMEVFHEI